MRICAVDLKGNDANLCLLELAHGLFNVPDCRTRKLTLLNPASTEEIRDFHKKFAKLMQDYKVDKIVIRERPMKGKFAGSAAGFKLEASLQLISDVDCVVFPTSELKQSLKKAPVVTFKELGLKQFQEQAFETALAYLYK